MQNGVDTPIEFLLPPHSKIAHEGLYIFPKTSLTFEKDSRFKYHYISIKGLSPNYSQSVIAVKKATYRFGGTIIGADALTKKYGVNSTPIVVDPALSYYISDDGKNILFQIDYDYLLTAKDGFETFEVDLYKKINDLATYMVGEWPFAITQELIEEIYADIPMPASFTMDRYLALGAREHNFSFILLTPKIWLNVDFVSKVQPLIPTFDAAGNIIDKADPKFWSFNLNGQGTVRFYRDKDGKIMQSAFLAPATHIDNPPNLVMPDANTTLQASSADIQLTQMISDVSFVGLFQKNFKPNNSRGNALDGPNTQNNFKLQNSQLLFFNFINQGLVDSLKNSFAPQSPDGSIITSVFGLRNLITPVIPVYINNSMQTLLFNSTVGIDKNMGFLPEIKKLKMCRVYKGRYRKMKFFNDDTLLLPTDRFNF